MLLGFLIIRQMSFLIFTPQLLRSLRCRAFRGPAIRFVRPEFCGRVEVAATGITAEFIGVRTGWCGHGRLALQDAACCALLPPSRDVAVTCRTFCHGARKCNRKVENLPRNGPLSSRPHSMSESTNNRDSRSVAVLLVGVAAGVVGSRVLPPLIAAVWGARRARQGNDPFELLIEDHRKILSVLQNMLQASESETARRASLFLSLKRTLGKHAMAEEDVVYPLWCKEGKQEQASKELYEEHAEMKIRLFELEQMLKSGVDWRPTVQDLYELIRGHIEEEENVVFPHLKQHFDQDRSATVAGQISREEALVL